MNNERMMAKRIGLSPELRQTTSSAQMNQMNYRSKPNHNRTATNSRLGSSNGNYGNMISKQI